MRYRLTDLPEGRHTLDLKAWDVYNNSSVKSTEFVVAPSAELALEHVLNYPNPFTTHTEFYFEHNRPAPRWTADPGVHRFGPFSEDLEPAVELRRLPKRTHGLERLG